jgi:hypothetical protein
MITLILFQNSIDPNKSFLPSYQGGDNPILIYGFFISMSILVSVVLGYSLFTYTRKYRFHRFCTLKGLSKLEIGYLLDLTTKLHVSEPLSIMSSASSFDLFMNRVSHYYQHQIVSDEDFSDLIDFAGKIRTKLYNRRATKGRHSSRTIPMHSPVMITCYNKHSSDPVSFPAKVIDNNDFFLGITLPESAADREACTVSGVSIQIEFVRKNDAEYFFETQLVRAVFFPKRMWYLRHSEDLQQGELHRYFTIPASVMAISDTEETQSLEYEATIRTITNEACSFIIDEKSPPIKPDTTLLINFEVNEELFSCRGHIDKTYSREDRTTYRLSFRGMEPDENLQLLTAVRKMTEELDKANQLAYEDK